MTKVVVEFETPLPATREDIRLPYWEIVDVEDTDG